MKILITSQVVERAILTRMSTRFISSKPYSILEYKAALSKYGFLIGVLAKRELSLKYSRTLLGFGWLFVQPLVLVMVYSFFFQNIVKLDTGSVPYPSFVFSGLVLWYIFTGIVGKCSVAFSDYREFISKVSFPKLIILVARIIPVVIECFIFLILLVLVQLIKGQYLGLQVVFTLFYFLHVIIFSFSVGIASSLMALRFRDLVHVIPFSLNFGLWLTPVFYSVKTVPQSYQKALQYLNPLTIPIEGFRASLFYNSGIPFVAFMSFMVSLLFLLLVLYTFIFFEKKIVELL